MEFQVLATRGIGGYRQYRIPALAITKSGRLIAIYDARPDIDDLPSPIDLVIRHSDDGGLTWSAQKIFREHEGITGYGDASIIVDPTIGNFGRVIVFKQVTKLAGFFESKLGSDVNDPMIAHIEISISDDNGESWKHQIITSQVKDEDTLGIFAASGCGSFVKSGEYKGRLLQNFLLRKRGELIAAIGFSDDHGENWTLGAMIPNGNESKSIGLTDGSILVHSRARPHRISSRSIDGGISLSYSAPDLELPDPSDNGSLTLLSDGSIICSHNHDEDLRKNLVIKRSFDGGVTWPEALIVEAGSSAYSSCAQLSDGQIGILFERNGYSEMVFASVGLHEFKSTAEILKKANKVTFDVVLRYIYPARILDLPTKRIEVEVPDISIYGAFQGKEIGKPIQTAGKIDIFTWEEFDSLLGPIKPGLHEGDELRFSGRLANFSDKDLQNICVENNQGFRFNQELLKAGEKVLFMDVRYKVTAEDIANGSVNVIFKWSADGFENGTIYAYSARTE